MKLFKTLVEKKKSASSIVPSKFQLSFVKNMLNLKLYAFCYIECDINNIIHLAMIMKETVNFKQSYFIHPLPQISGDQLILMEVRLQNFQKCNLKN